MGRLFGCGSRKQQIIPAELAEQLSAVALQSCFPRPQSIQAGEATAGIKSRPTCCSFLWKFLTASQHR